VHYFGLVVTATAALLAWSLYHHLKKLLAFISHLTELLREEA
jgi:hypothetical protein